MSYILKISKQPHKLIFELIIQMIGTLLKLTFLRSLVNGKRWNILYLKKNNKNKLVVPEKSEQWWKFSWDFNSSSSYQKLHSFYNKI